MGQLGIEMPNLVFHGEGGEASVVLSDELSIDLASGKLAVGGGPNLASHHEGSWWIGNVVVTRITCDGPIALSMGTGSHEKRFGPFTDLVIGANTIWTAQGPLARYNAFTKVWLPELKEAEGRNDARNSRLAAA